MFCFLNLLTLFYRVCGYPCVLRSCIFAYRPSCLFGRIGHKSLINALSLHSFRNKVSPLGAARRYAPADGSSTVVYRFAANQAISTYTYINTVRVVDEIIICNKDLRQSIDPKIAADLYVRPRTGPQSAHLWWPAVAKLQAASVPTA